MAYISQVARSGGGTRRSGIFYYPNNAGGVTSAVFTSTAGTYLAGQLMEWSGIGTTSPLDVCDRAGNTSATTSLTVNSGGSNCASGSTGYSNELAISTFQEHLDTAGTVTFTPGAGWTNAGNTGASSVSMQYTSDYETGVALNTAISETQTSSVASDLNGGWEGILVTFAPPTTCTGGSLTLSAASAQFNSTTLNGKDKTVTTSNNPPVFTPSDQRGTGAGWNITLTSTQFTVSRHTLPTTATTLTSVQDSADAGTCSVPTNSVTYPVTVPAGAGPPAAIKIYNAALNTGRGDSQLTLNFSLALPASAYVGSYTSTWTFSIVTGP